jgi:carbon storage regulator
MLVLNRRPGEAILLDGGIRVVVLSCDRRGVRLGIEAPADVNIQREELVSQVAAQNRKASAGATGAAWVLELPLKGGPR